MALDIHIVTTGGMINLDWSYPPTMAFQVRESGSAVKFNTVFLDLDSEALYLAGPWPRFVQFQLLYDSVHDQAAIRWSFRGLKLCSRRYSPNLPKLGASGRVKLCKPCKVRKHFCSESEPPMMFVVDHGRTILL